MQQAEILNDERIFTQMVPMRDGTKLFTEIHLPGGLPGPFPVNLIRSPYNDPRGALYYQPEWIKEGIAWVLQDTRGTGRSEGKFYPNVPEIDDGTDTVDFILAQTWCNGRIFMSGGSYVGATQWFAAKDSGKKLIGIAPFVASINYHESSRYFFGAMMLSDVLGWGFNMQRNKNFADQKIEYDIQKAYRHLPLRDMDTFCGFPEKLPFWQDLLDHPGYDAFWARTDVRSYIGDIECPAYVASGWFDSYQAHSLDAVMLMRTKGGSERARKFSRCVIGPWRHGNEEIGELKPPEAADGTSRAQDGNSIRENYSRKSIRFLVNLSRDPDKDPLPGEPPIRYFVMGSNEWRASEVWPPEGVKHTDCFLHSGGMANSLYGDGTLDFVRPGNETPDTFFYNPENPVMTAGGRDFASGSFDQTETEKRADVLVYTSDVLDKDVVVAGRIIAELWIASSAPDTDFTAKLVDVYPDGRALNVANGILRCGYRDSLAERKLMTPGEKYRITVDLWNTANCFRAGHRIRLEISSSDFPNFDRNLNTGHPYGEDAEIATARQTVFHDAVSASKVILPILPE